MSGIEVAGLVLGAFPIALQVLDHYKEVARRFGFWYKIAAEHKRCDSQLKFHQLVYISHLKKLLLPLAGLDDTHIDELLQIPGSKAWAEPKIVGVLEMRLGNSYEIYVQCMGEYQEELEAMRHKLAFDPTTKQQSQESSSATPTGSRSGSRMLRDQGKWQLYRVKFSQAEKDRNEIFTKLGDCNNRLKILLQISEENTQLVGKRLSVNKNESNAMCRIWRQAERVFTALAVAWNCDCRARHSMQLLLEHRTSTTSDFHLLYDDDSRRIRGARKVRISVKATDYDNPSAIKSSFSNADTRRNIATPTSNHRASTPRKSAMKKTNARTLMDESQPKPSVTITAAGESIRATLSSASSAKPITSLCLSLECSDSQLCGFINEDEYRYYVYQEPVIRTDSPRTITLDQLLRRDGLPTPTRRQRVALAFILSSSFFQLLESPWLPASWQKSDIVFFEDANRPGNFRLAEPHLKNNLDNKVKSNIPTQSDHRMQLSSSLELLGIILLELCFGQLLEEQPLRVKHSEIGNITIQRALDITAAKQWHAEIEEEAGYAYSVAVGWCLGGIFSTPTDRWREVMLDKVVHSLEACHRHLHQQDS